MNNINPSILQINTFGTSGGAGKAAYRLHRGLLNIGQNSRFLVRVAETTEITDPTIAVASPDHAFQRALLTDAIINSYYILANRSALSNTYFSYSYPGYDLSRSRMVKDCDIINLHWIEEFLSSVSLHAIIALNKPVIWTLHDQKPFTGGCHYSAGCDQYRESCLNCPQLANDPIGMPSAVLKDKLELFRGANLTIVAPSTWLATEAYKSSLFSSQRIEVIPNAVETDIYHPVAKEKAKQLLGIDPGTITILFGTTDATETRKGFKHLLAAAHGLLKNAQFKELITSGRLLILCVGKYDTSIHEIELPIRHMGYIDNDHTMATVYNASDLLVLPSLEDNLPNTMLEAMSCGTPVVAFDIGGMPDVIADGITGRLVECGNETRLGNAILELVLHDADRRMMGAASSILIREKFNPEVQANAYLGLYNDLLKQDVRYKVGVVPSVKRYGPSTSRIYSKLLQFSIQNQMRIQFDIHVKSKLILYFMSFMLRFIVRIMPITIFIRIRGFLRKIVSTLRGYSYMFVFLSFHSK